MPRGRPKGSGKKLPPLTMVQMDVPEAMQAEIAALIASRKFIPRSQAEIAQFFREALAWLETPIEEGT